MKITIHRGSRQIGGSCVEIACDDGRLIIDAGLPLDDDLPAPALPFVEGLSEPGSPIDAILLSHAHSDHSGLLERTHRDIPILCSEGTSKMLTLASIFTPASRLPKTRIYLLPEAIPHQIGAFKVTAFPVDHSIYGSSAFLIEHGGKRILYSGDLRMHGRKPGMTSQLIRASSRAPLDALIMEGTHVGAGRPQGTTETRLEDDIAGIMSETSGLALCLFSPMNLDRLVTFYKAARKAGRIFVPDLYAATCIRFVKSNVRVPFPHTKNGMRVYFNQTAPRLKKLRVPFVKSEISLEEILREPHRYAMISRPSMIERDFSTELPEGSTCIYSMWRGYLQRPEWSTLRERLASPGSRFKCCHASGHIYVDDLVNLIQKLAPRMILPIHTSAPELYSTVFPKQTVARLTDGQPIDI